ncbi:MAG TPA: DUF3016 domain-containing protein [Opitutaceae bacterium]|nr:DUF3016 domain-containing protein [Opitutaceae bacterium]
MNRRILQCACLLGVLGPGAMLAADTAKPNPASVVVTFDHPDKFTDVKDAYMPTEKGRDAILDQIKGFVESRAKSYLRAGQKLEVKFTDIDLAGEFEPQRGPRFNDVRIVKDIYMPRLKLEFKLTGADGKVINEGKRDLTDSAFMMRSVFPPSDELRFEKDILSDWLRSDVRAPARAAG